jgi:hypothetical protein
MDHIGRHCTQYHKANHFHFSSLRNSTHSVCIYADRILELDTTVDHLARGGADNIVALNGKTAVCYTQRAVRCAVKAMNCGVTNRDVSVPCTKDKEILHTLDVRMHGCGQRLQVSRCFAVLVIGGVYMLKMAR